MRIDFYDLIILSNTYLSEHQKTNNYTFRLTRDVNSHHHQVTFWHKQRSFLLDIICWEGPENNKTEFWIYTQHIFQCFKKIDSINHYVSKLFLHWYTEYIRPILSLLLTVIKALIFMSLAYLLHFLKYARHQERRAVLQLHYLL